MSGAERLEHETTGSALVELAGLMTRLRRECAWKRAQTHESLARYVIEEAHETVEAIESGSSEHLREELGDLLLQVYFHAEIAREAGEYDVEDVARDLIAKLVRRNPHVFSEDGSQRTDDLYLINESWENLKRAEKGRVSPTEGIPTSLPALLYADKVIDRCRRAGSPLSVPEVAGESGRGADAIGERFLALCLQAHADGLDAEQALKAAVRRRVC